MDESSRRAQLERLERLLATGRLTQEQFQERSEALGGALEPQGPVDSFHGPAAPELAELGSIRSPARVPPWGVYGALGLLSVLGLVSLWRLLTPPEGVQLDLRDVDSWGAELPPGVFTMGCDPEQSHCPALDHPAHEVTLSRGLWVGRTEVTLGQVSTVLGLELGEDDDPHFPAGSVSWPNALRFANALSERQGLELCYTLEEELNEEGETKIFASWPKGVACEGYRLPTEAEWEYLARAKEPFLFSGSQRSEDVAWFGRSIRGGLQPVGAKQPNAWGLYDMSGNAAEWVWDIYAEDFYQVSPELDPIGPILRDRNITVKRVTRGGSSDFGETRCRVDFRKGYLPDYASPTQGFRLVRSL